MGPFFLCVSEVVDPLARVAAHLGCIVPRAGPMGAPVLAPLLVSLSMIGAGLLYLTRDSRGRVMRWSLLNRLGILAGAVIVILTFTLDFRNISAGGMPHDFHWSLFLFGETIGLTSFLLTHSIVESRR